MPIPEKFQSASRQVGTGGGIDISSEGFIYGINVYQFRIYVFDTALQLLRVVDFENPPDYRPLTDQVLRQSQRGEVDILEESSMLMDLLLVERRDGNQDIIVRCHDIPNENTYHFIDDTGRLIHSVDYPNKELITVKGNLLYFYDRRTEPDGTPIESMKIYEYNR